MNVYIIVEMQETDTVFEKLNVEKISMDKFLTERKLSVNYDQEKILNSLYTELSRKKNDVLIRYYHDIDSLVNLSNKLKENNHRLHTVFIPSPQQLLIRKEEELEFTRKHANWASFSASQIEEGYQEWIKIYEKIKQELPKYAIEVKEV
ncbi:MULTISPECIES: hypothetical protein [unclassified Arcicella]|uniref:hypothetical protein n=1 Tax=unclassified Arcicella TaxID=2644986 RepID=UPI0028589471|nr:MULTISPECIES: hypothetical protein [unclassified Arcicella]MDR6562682.1 beta-mannanase [Arcicella sp. BE51]MDR6812973.1 beta-mannanase [Arcicella sp. BE140]MDR6824287.1 beta-mannanase [Arcicella sp. BE139]